MRLSTYKKAYKQAGKALFLVGATALPFSESAADTASGMTSTTSTSTTVTARAEETGDRDLDGLPDPADPCPDDARNECYGPVAVDVGTGLALRIQATGPRNRRCSGERLDCTGESWLADAGASTPGRLLRCRRHKNGGDCRIEGITELFGCDDTATRDLLRCGRRGLPPGRVLAYDFALPRGPYLVNVFLAGNAPRPHTGGPGRGVDIVAEGATAYQSFDPNATAGESIRAVVRSLRTFVADGGLRLELRGVGRFVALRAIEVRSLTCATAAECDDGDICTGESCVDGECVYQATASECDDGNYCTRDTCLANACVHVSDSALCDDDDPCTLDTCTVQGCAHAADLARCDDGDPCTIDTCTPEGCQNLVDPSMCDDGDSCTIDRCTAGVCTNELNSTLCDDDDPCTNDTCVNDTCIHVATIGPCDDGIACTTGDTCTDGLCSGVDACPAGQFCSHAAGRCFSQAGDSDKDGLAGLADPCPEDPRNLCAGPVAIDQNSGKPIRVNANVSSAECAGAKTDCTGARWQADFGYNVAGQATVCDLGGGGEGCEISGIEQVFGCTDESTEDLFQCEHFDAPDPPELAYSFAVESGRYLVNLYFANTYTGTEQAGTRVFDIRIEGETVYESFDPIIAAGGSGIVVVRSAVAIVENGDGLQIELGRRTENPAIKAIEVLAFPCEHDLDCEDPSPCMTGTCADGVCRFSEVSGACDDGIACTTGDSCVDGRCIGDDACTGGGVCITETGVCSAPPISFTQSVLQSASPANPTSLQFGPDGRLYVAEQDGLIQAYTITRAGVGDYRVTAAETISAIRTIANHDDDGTPRPDVATRLVTGILVSGTAASPVIYVSSSDPRIGGGENGTTTNLDTNSGVVSTLTRTGPSWSKLDLVRGLPRSEENHGGNGMQLDATMSTLYLAYGGNTNQGAPSNNFAFLPEYALSAAILAIDLAAIGDTIYDLPTLDDEDRLGTIDANDPFGGNDGKNQAVVVPGGPVEIFSPGWRNPYDLVLTTDGLMYAVDNGGNAGWGDAPIGNGTSACTNEVSEPGLTWPDALHLVGGAGYYGGHPNPTRANAANTFNSTNPQSPIVAANPSECTFLAPGTAEGALLTFPQSTNGLAEYTATNFGGQMTGDLLAAAWNGKVWRIELDDSGADVDSATVIFSNAGTRPLDLIAQGNAGPFPGTIWVADWQGGQILVYEPADAAACTRLDDPGLDEDMDGYSNADEIANGTDPCSAADTPADADGDFVSDRSDPDDDNDGVPDTSDPFARDAKNGRATAIPVQHTWENADTSAGGILGLGFTGLMTNGIDDYETLFDDEQLTAGGAAGVVTIDLVPEGDALGSLNTQQFGFQFGIDVGIGGSPFSAHTRVLGPFAGTTPVDFQSMGLFVGDGTQDGYVKIVLSANGGGGAVEVVGETFGVAAAGAIDAMPLPGPSAVDLYLTVDPVALTVQPYYRASDVGVHGMLTALGTPLPIPGTWLSTPSNGLAVGILSTSRDSLTPFAVTWDFLAVELGHPPAP